MEGPIQDMAVGMCGAFTTVWQYLLRVDGVTPTLIYR